MTATVGDMAHHHYAVAAPLDATAQVADVLAQKRFLVVKDRDRFVGILTPADVVARPHKLVVDCVTRKPVLDARTRPFRALSVMNRHFLPALAVFRRERFSGVVTYRELTGGLPAGAPDLEKHLDKIEQYDVMAMTAAGALHDFNNLLVGLQWHLTHFGQRYGHDREFATSVRELSKWMDRARSLTRQLVHYSSTGSAVEHITDTVDAIRRNVTFFLAGSAVRPVFCLDPGLWLVHMDGRDLSRIIGNLVANARDAMPNGGRLEVMARNFPIPDRGATEDIPDGAFVKLTVADTGHGIPKERLSRIFQTGFTTKPEGTGLGLAVIRMILERQGGHITAQSVRPRGTAFDVYLPASDPEASSQD